MSAEPPHVRFEPPILLETARRLRAVTHPLRLRIFTELAAAGRLRTGDVATLVDEPANKVSYHLSALTQAGVIRRAEPPASSTDGRETWWELASETGFSWDITNADLDAVAADLQTMGDAVIADLRARSFPLVRAGGWHAIEGQLPIDLTKAEADELFGRLVALLEDVFELRRRRLAAGQAGTPEPTDATYLLSVEYFPFRLTAGQPPVS